MRFACPEKAGLFRNIGAADIARGSATLTAAAQVRGLVFIGIVAGRCSRAGGIGDEAKVGRQLVSSRAREAVQAAVRGALATDAEIAERGRKADEALRYAPLGGNTVRFDAVLRTWATECVLTVLCVDARVCRVVSAMGGATSCASSEGTRMALAVLTSLR